MGSGKPPWFLPSDFLFCGDTAALAWGGEKKSPVRACLWPGKSPPHQPNGWELLGQCCLGVGGGEGMGSIRHFLDKALLCPPVRGQPSPAAIPPSPSPIPSTPALEREANKTGSSLLQGSPGQRRRELAVVPGNPGKEGGSLQSRPGAWGRALHETHLFDSGPVLQDVDLLQHVHDVRACNRVKEAMPKEGRSLGRCANAQRGSAQGVGWSLGSTPASWPPGSLGGMCGYGLFQRVQEGGGGPQASPLLPLPWLPLMPSPQLQDQ